MAYLPRSGMTAGERLTARVASPVVRRLLRSPLHVLLGGRVALLGITGRRSGRRFAIPVNVRRDGDRLYAVSRPHRRWWRNLRGGADVTVTLGGRDRPGRASARRDGDVVRVTVELA
jgi:hypothetical protein